MGRRLEKELDNSHDERQAQCRDGNDNPTSQTCQTWSTDRCSVTKQDQSNY